MASVGIDGAMAHDPTNDAIREGEPPFGMPLIGCPACGRQISTVAAACPQCGHPNQPASLGPTPCKSCSQPAIGACKTCGGFYCAEHGGVTSYGPLCSACYACKSCGQLPIGVCPGCGGFYCASHLRDCLVAAPNIRGATTVVTSQRCDACTPNQTWLWFRLGCLWFFLIVALILVFGGLFLSLARFR
jgi:hypothetical protein